MAQPSNLPRRPRAAASRRGPTREGPRERLLHHGAARLSDAELVALVLRTGGPRAGALELAQSLVGGEGALLGLAGATPGELARRGGLGPAKSASLAAAFELGRRVAARRLRPGDPVRGAGDVFAHLHPRLRHARVERFLALLLDGRHRLLREEEVSRGTLTASLVHPREVFRSALREGAAAVVLVHNHPSGDPTPSAEDREVTRRLVRCGELLGVPVLDHVVVAERGYASLRDEGLVPGGRR